MSGIILLLHVLFCIAIIALVLLQQGKGADVGAAFGSGSANSMFGSRGPASFLFKLTVLFALLFFVTSVSLTYFQAQNISAANTLAPRPVTTSAPAAPSNPTSFVPPAVNVGS